MPEQHRHLVNKCEHIVNLQRAEAYCVATRTACWPLAAKARTCPRSKWRNVSSPREQVCPLPTAGLHGALSSTEVRHVNHVYCFCRSLYLLCACCFIVCTSVSRKSMGDEDENRKSCAPLMKTEITATASNASKALA